MRNRRIISGVMGFLALCAVGGGADASFLNAPHQDLKCVDCHVYPLSGEEWYNASGAKVFPPVSPTIDDQLRNYICRMCHDGSKAGIPGKKMHSSHSFTPGDQTWTTLCVDCHDPHFQSQLQHKDDPGLFLASGTITGVTTPAPGQSTIAFAGLAGKSTGAITGDWTAKTSAGRGLVLVIDTTKPEYTFEIIAKANGTITVNGTVNPDSFTANTTRFGIIYGQLLRDKVYTGKDADGDGWGDYRRMRFFDSEVGGFTGDKNADGVIDGVCQVCHTNTSHWTRAAATDPHYADKDCTGCHFVDQGFKPPYVPDHTAQYVRDTALCVTCHKANDPMGVHGGCQTCHTSITPGSITFIDPLGSTKVIRVQRGECITCHGDYFPKHTHHYGANNQLAFNAVADTSQINRQPCSNCHKDADLVNGTSIRLSTFTAILYEHDLDGVKDGSTNACSNCHFYTGNKSAPLADVRSAIASGQDASCATCHTDKAPNVNHGGHAVTDFMPADSACLPCHNDNGLGAVDGVHGGNCNACHVDALNGNYARKNGDATFGSDGDARLAVAPNARRATCLTCHPNAAAKAGRGVIHHISKNNLVGQNLCDSCHNGSHPADHSLKVAPVTECVACHTNTAGMTSGIQVNPDDDKVHDFCVTCHVVNGDAITLKTTITAGNCNTCHGQYFPSHSHHYGAKNDLAYNSAVDTSQPSVKGCALCHNDSGGALATFAAIFVEHKSVCNNCHAYTGNKTAPLAAVRSAISSGSPATCATCHTDKVPNVTHGHDVSDFGHAAGGICITCHNQTGGVIVGIHANNCALCHVDAVNGNYARKLGDSTFGVDGDARLAVGATARQATCETCHPAATYPVAGIHHLSKNGYAAAWNCGQCHNATYKPDHSLLVAPYVNCTRCHAAAAGTVDGITVDQNDNKIHDACSTCHRISGNQISLITLPSPNGWATAMKAGGATCFDCHGQYFDKHKNINHTDRIKGATVCTTCHAATAASGTTVPLSETDDKVHDNCFACHQATGALVAATTKAPGIASPGGDCMFCHGAYFANHSHHYGVKNQLTYDPAGGDTSQLSRTPCADCHNHNDAGNKLATFASILTEHRNNCAICHEYDGIGSPPLAAVRDSIALDGARHCRSCHTDKVPDKEHGGHPATDFRFDSNCSTCHSDGGRGVVAGIHQNSCFTCHNNDYTRKLGDASYGVDGDARLATGATARQAGCTVCHPAGTYGHATATDHNHRPVSTECAGCHHQVSSQAAIDTTHRANCFTCHGYSGTKLNATTVANAIKNGKGTAGVDATCATCHTANHGTTNATAAAVHNMFGATTTCADCHVIGTAEQRLALHPNCTTCHASTKTAVTGAITAGRAGTAVQCATCHSGGTGTAITHGLDAAGAAAVHDKFDTVTPCSNCHSTATAAARISLHPNCLTCHAATASTTVKNAIAAGIAGTTVNCTTCHGTDVKAAHHNSTHAKSGNCVYCHADSRPWSAAPTIAACRQCHVGTNGMVVTAAPAPSHAINTSGAITDFGACFACHAVMPFHAKPVPASSNRYDNMATAPGRGTFNLFWNEFHGYKGVNWGRESYKNNQNRYRYAGVSFRTSTLKFGSTTYVVPHFDAANTIMPTPAHARIMVPANCTSCHSGNVATVIHKSNCFGCHMSTDAVVRATLGRAAGGATVTCTDCHSGVSNGHDAPAVHNMLNVAGVTCGRCHAVGGGTFNEVYALHLSNCMTCHASVDPLVVSAITNGKNGVSVTCSTCHGASASAAHHAATQAKTGNCTYCHADTRPWASAPKLMACRQCHVSASGYVVTASPAPSHAHNTQGAIQNYGACLSCHNINVFHAKPATAPNPGQAAPGRGSFNLFYSQYNRPEKYYEGTSYESYAERNLKNNRRNYQSPQVSYRTAALKFGATTYTVPHFDAANVTMPSTHTHPRITATTGCSSCHAVTSIITGTHKGDCQGCHLSQDPVVQATITSGRAGTTVQCSNCHASATGDHNAPAVHDRLSATTTCNSCHAFNATTFTSILALHLNDCMRCHASARAEVQATIAAGKAGTAVNCSNCHGSSHHSNAHAKAGDCTWCHADPRSTWVSSTPGDNGGTSPYPTQLACVTCHVRVSGTTIYIDKLTYSNNGSPAARTVQHTLTGITSGYIYNYGACFSCHNGVKALAPSPFHPKPAAASSNRYDNQIGPGRGTFNVFWNEFHGREDASFGRKSYDGNQNRYQNPASGYGTKITIPCRTISNNDCTGTPIAVPVLPAKPKPVVP